jgi:hypothetical protein
MKIHEQNIRISYLNNEEKIVSLKWLRGASRYNNGATIYGKKYFFRFVMSRAKNKNQLSL